MLDLGVCTGCEERGAGSLGKAWDPGLASVPGPNAPVLSLDLLRTFNFELYSTTDVSES